MARVHVVLPHSLDVATTEARVRAFLESPEVRSRLGGEPPRWSKGRVDLQGEGWSGFAAITARDVEFDLQLGGLLGLFAGTVESELKSKLGEALR